MRRRKIIILILFVVVLGVLAIPYVCHITSYGPMVALPVMVTRGGLSISADEIVSFRYAFSERSTTLERVAPSSPLKEARPMAEGFYLVEAPFTVSGPGWFFRTSASPLYHSLTLEIVLQNGGTTTLIYPVRSDTKVNGEPIYLDLPSLR
ncbi:hypothetical protein BH09VER1_BH09VER1_46090 [soil metagenome]